MQRPSHRRRPGLRRCWCACCPPRERGVPRRRPGAGIRRAGRDRRDCRGPSLVLEAGLPVRTPPRRPPRFFDNRSRHAAPLSRKEPNHAGTWQRPPVRVAHGPARTHRHGLGDAGDCAGHRREHRHVQRDGRGLPPSAAVPGAGSARAVQHDGRTLRRRSGGELPRRAGLAIVGHASRTARPLRCRAGNRTACGRCPAVFGHHHGRNLGGGACARHPRASRTAAAAGGVPVRRPGKRDARVPILAVALRQRSVRGGPLAAARQRAAHDRRRAGRRRPIGFPRAARTSGVR